MHEVHIVADWPERAATRGWRIAEVIAIDENGFRRVLQIIKTTAPVKLTERKVT